MVNRFLKMDKNEEMNVINVWRMSNIKPIKVPPEFDALFQTMAARMHSFKFDVF